MASQDRHQNRIIDPDAPLRQQKCRVGFSLDVFALVLAVAIVCAGGCESAPRANGLSLAVQDYNAAKYESAHKRSVEAMRQSGVDRHEAAYLAGLSAYQMNDLHEAELRFRAASRSSNREVAGRAEAMLGQIHLEHHRPKEAAALFESAVRSLRGNDQRQAARYAAIAHREAGDRAAADRWERRSPATVVSSGSGAFAIQVGAFAERDRAERAARIAAPYAEREGDGDVRIAPSTDARGRTLYLVQFGSFPTRNSADDARNRIGRLDYIVTPMASAAR